MRLLIIGGTGFLGRALVDAALAAECEVTLFHRGQLDSHPRDGVETLLGDRNGDLDQLAGRTWDAVVDTCGYTPGQVHAAAAALAGAVDHYTFISTVSVYAQPSQGTIDETAPLSPIGEASLEEVTANSYGPLKALCEQAATEAMDGRALHVRAGLIVGPGDRSDRFTYWPWRVAQGGEILAPGSPETQVQFIDVRDLAAWVLQATRARLQGPYNAAGPAEPVSMESLLTSCLDQIGADGCFTWVAEEFLLDQDVTPYTEMPLWIPAEAGLDRVDAGRARAAGLAFRPLGATVLDTLDWVRTRPQDHQWRAGLRHQREIELLSGWHQQQGAP
ncbi:MAG: NAD-dependent epimerase/dehydratase family protein [Candidatus Latescibacteria bacterium]|nr:NAD-dependent epimerase/dehydratase family protein [Candidatus Latescibacterota bacterium]